MVTSGIQPFLPPHQEILFQQRQAPACHLTSKKNSLLLSAPTCSKPTLLSLSLPQGRPPCRAPASYRHPPPGPHPVLASRMLSESGSCSVVSYIIHGILQARILEWVAFPFSRASSQPRDWAQYPTLQANSLPAEPPGKPTNTGMGSLSLLQWVFLTQELTKVPCIAGWLFTSWAVREARIESTTMYRLPAVSIGGHTRMNKILLTPELFTL